MQLTTSFISSLLGGGVHTYRFEVAQKANNVNTHHSVHLLVMATSNVHEMSDCTFGDKLVLKTEFDLIFSRE